MALTLRRWLAIVSTIAGVLLASTAAAVGAPPAAKSDESPGSLFLISYHAGPNWRPGVPMKDQGLRDHFFYVKALNDSGRVAVAGAVGGDGGLILLRASDQADADRVIAADPAVRAGLFVGEARPFTPRFVGKEAVLPVKP